MARDRQAVNVCNAKRHYSLPRGKLAALSSANQASAVQWSSPVAGPRVAAQVLQVGGGALPVQIAEALLPAEPVKAGRDDGGGGLLVGGTGELGVEPQRGGALGVAESSGDGVEVDAVRQQLSGLVMSQLLQRAGDADPSGVPAVPVGHRVGIPWLPAYRVRGERERVF